MKLQATRQDDDDDDRGATRPARGTTVLEQVLAQMTAIAQEETGEPFVATTPNAPAVRSVLHAGIGVDDLLDTWRHYCRTREDPAAISVEYFCGRFSEHHAAMHRAKAQEVEA